MNAEPHVHNVRLRRRWQGSGNGEGPWIVEYGDTKVPVHFMGRFWVNHEDPPPSDRQLHRAIRKAIGKHDRGSIKAGKQKQLPPKVVMIDKTNAALYYNQNSWGSDTVRNIDG